jgi:hypothetical protein
MKTFKKFIAEGLVYGNDDLMGSKRGPYSGPRVQDLNPHPIWERHYGNALHLQFILKNSKDMKERHQANKELEFATKKMAFWQKHPDFDAKKAADIATKLRKQWNV